jgi:hypothetical protein
LVFEQGEREKRERREREQESNHGGKCGGGKGGDGQHSIRRGKGGWRWMDNKGTFLATATHKEYMQDVAIHPIT